MIFLTGFPRSGTSLLATIIDRHDKITVTPETRYFEEIYRGKKIEEKNHLINKIYNSKRLKDLNLEFDYLQKKSDEYLNVFDVFRELMEKYNKKIKTEVVCEKSPIHSKYMEVLLNEYEDSKFVYIVRDPRESILSLIKVPWAHNSVIRHSCEWKYRFNEVNKIIENHSSRVLLIKYEDLMRDPEEIMVKTMDFIGYKFSKEQLIPKNNTSTHSDWEAEWKNNVNRPIIMNNSNKWKTELSMKQIILSEYIMHDDLKKLDYDLLNFKGKVSYLYRLYSFILSRREYIYIRDFFKKLTYESY